MYTHPTITPSKEIIRIFPTVDPVVPTESSPPRRTRPRRRDHRARLVDPRVDAPPQLVREVVRGHLRRRTRERVHGDGWMVAAHTAWRCFNGAKQYEEGAGEIQGTKSPVS